MSVNALLFNVFIYFFFFSKLCASTSLLLHFVFMFNIGDYLLSCSTDQHWAFSDIRTGHVLTRCLSDPNINQGNKNSPNYSERKAFFLVLQTLPPQTFSYSIPDSLDWQILGTFHSAKCSGFKFRKKLALN